MGNHQSQNQNSHHQKKHKRKDQLKQLLSIKREIIFSKLSLKTLSIISSFLTIHEFNNLLLTSRSCYQLFSQTSGCFQVECHRLLNIKCDQILSHNWKMIIQSIICIPIRGLPYGEAIKSVRTSLKQLPCFIEQNIYYSPFQKSILYFQNLLKQKQQLLNTLEFSEAKVFGAQNIDTLLKVRQGQEIHTQLPPLLMLIYNLHDYIKIYNLYLEIRFEKCNMNQFIQLWKHYQGWICSVEQQTLDLIFQFNEIIENSLPQYNLPKYTIRNFMVCEWMKKANRGEIIVRLREEFRLNMIECREQNLKNQDLKDYIQYLVDISTNEYNIHQYGYYNFQYCQEINELIKITVELSPKLNIDYCQDENILIFIFGQYIYDYYLFEELQSFRIEQFIQEIKSHQNDSQDSTKILDKYSDDLNQTTSQSLISNFEGLEISGFQNQLQTTYNETSKIKSLFKQINKVSFLEDEVSTTNKNLATDSLGTSGMSLTSINCSFLFSSMKVQDQQYNHIKSQYPELYQKIQQFYQKESEVNQYTLQNEPQNQNLYDIPELCDYLHISFEGLKELLQNRVQRSQTIFQQKRRQSSLIISSQSQQKQIFSTELSQAENVLSMFSNEINDL